ncbi:hypothetical protein C0993_002930 [Termitomyces sp. T159_Od127]|nr:hypothetical protein C0993_002930 [Termitomyces sp. T159_Od127]
MSNPSVPVTSVLPDHHHPDQYPPPLNPALYVPPVTPGLDFAHLGGSFDPAAIPGKTGTGNLGNVQPPSSAPTAFDSELTAILTALT